MSPAPFVTARSSLCCENPHFHRPLLIAKRQKDENFFKSQNKNDRMPHGQKCENRKNPSESRTPEMGMELKNRVALGHPFFLKTNRDAECAKNRDPSRALPENSASIWYESHRIRWAVDLGATKRKFQHSQSSQREGIKRKCYAAMCLREC